RNLERQIIATPDDPGPYLVYADWLQKQDDPRGQLIIAQHQRSGAPANDELRKLEARLLRKHRASLVPASLVELLARKPRNDDPDGRCELRWRLGFLSHVRLARREGPELHDVLGALLEHASGRYLRALAIGPLDKGTQFDFAEVVDVLAEHQPRLLEAVVLGDGAGGIAGDGAGRLFELPALKRLVSGVSLDIQRPTASSTLQELECRVPASDATLTNLLTAKFDKLHTLVLTSPELGAASLAALRTTDSLPTLCQLRLHDTIGKAAILPNLAVSPILRRLKVLAIQNSYITDDEVEIIVRNAPRFGHLRHLELNGHGLTSDGVRRISKVCERVTVCRLTRSAIVTEDEIAALAPDDATRDAARAIADPRQWQRLVRNGDKIAGTHAAIETEIELGRFGHRRCACHAPRPCMHILAALLIAASNDLPED
ncbi:MAG: TIGR02996 domain-containing protein, partial [Kofleriaceae bacterium]